MSRDELRRSVAGREPDALGSNRSPGQLPQAGAILGDYTLRHRLGAGTFAEVWRATERGGLGFRTEVALKILRPTRQGEAELAALLKEAALCARLRHPNIVGVRRVVEHEGLVLVVMELVEGGTLTDLVERSSAHGLTLPRSVVLDIAIDLARGLDHAWEGLSDEGVPFRVVHRDLKPANVLLARTGEARIADFGIAHTAGDATATAVGTLKGTPAYVAPEIWGGGRDFRPVVDLFAIGCILFELVTLRRLFDGQSIPELFARVAMGDATEDTAPVRRAFPELAPILESLLQRDPEARTQTARELLDRLLGLRATVYEGRDVDEFLALLEAIEGSGSPPRALTRPSPPAADDAWTAAVACAAGAEEAREWQEPAAATTSGGPRSVGTESVQQPVPGTTRLVDPRGNDGAWSRIVGWLAGPRWQLALAGIAAVLLLLLLREPNESPLSPSEPTAGAPAVARTDPGAGADEPRTDAATRSSNATATPPPLSSPTPRPPGAGSGASHRRTSPGGASAVHGAEGTGVATPGDEAGAAVVAPSTRREAGAGAEGAPSREAEAAPAGAPQPVVMVAPPTPKERPERRTEGLAPAPGCLVFQSVPPGAEVWVAGEATGLRARSGDGAGVERAAGPVIVEMGVRGERAVKITVVLEPGRRQVVRCDLARGTGCRVTAGGGCG